MSCVISYISSDFAFIAGDGRAINLETREIYSEDYKKVRKINDNVILGFTGTDEVCLGALSALPTEVSKMNVDSVSSILCKEAKKIPASTGLGGSFVLAGWIDGQMAMISFGRKNQYSIDKVLATDAQSFLQGYYPDEIGRDIFYECFLETSGDELGLIVANTFRKVSELSYTVNEQISFVTLGSSPRLRELDVL